MYICQHEIHQDLVALVHLPHPPLHVGAGPLAGGEDDAEGAHQEEQEVRKRHRHFSSQSIVYIWKLCVLRQPSPNAG